MHLQKKHFDRGYPNARVMKRYNRIRTPDEGEKKRQQKKKKKKKKKTTKKEEERRRRK